MANIDTIQVNDVTYGLVDHDSGTILSNKAENITITTTYGCINSLTVPPGSWIIIGQVNYSSNTSGTRRMVLSTFQGTSTSLGTTAQRVCFPSAMSAPCATGGQKKYTISGVATFTATTTVYINIKTGAGTASSTQTIPNSYLKAIRVV